MARRKRRVEILPSERERVLLYADSEREAEEAIERMLEDEDIEIEVRIKRKLCYRVRNPTPEEAKRHKLRRR